MISAGALSKVIDGTIYQHLLDVSRIIGEIVNNPYGIEIYRLIYLYNDYDGSPIGIKYRTPDMGKDSYYCYCFEKNLQGDIIAVYTEDGRKICTYTYDAWGICTTTTVSGNVSIENTIANIYNPFRYRGYYYDYETGFYYLQSRYYNPRWGRFINADSCLYSNLLGFNLFAYCNNNPVMYSDPKGEFPWLIIPAISVITALVASLNSCTSISPEEQEELDRKMLDPGAYETPDEALNAGLNDVKDKSAKVGMEYGGYVYERNGRYYYKSGADVRYSNSQENVFNIELNSNETLVAIFHSHPFHKSDAVFSLADFQYAKVYGVDSYIIDNEGYIYCLPVSARYQTEYFQVK